MSIERGRNTLIDISPDTTPQETPEDNSIFPETGNHLEQIMPFANQALQALDRIDQTFDEVITRLRSSTD